jgi:Homeodomain-like domain
VEQGLDEVLNRRPQPERPNKRELDGEQEAYLIALTCSSSPKGQGCWSVRLLAGKPIELGYVPEVSYETVQRTLKKRAQAVAEAAVVH